MAFRPGSEAPNEGAPEDYVQDHPREHPSQWGWHADLGKPARIAGWACVIGLLLMVTSTHYNGAGALALILTAAVIVVGLLWDINRRRTAWRK